MLTRPQASSRKHTREAGQWQHHDSAMSAWIICSTPGDLPELRCSECCLQVCSQMQLRLFHPLPQPVLEMCTHQTVQNHIRYLQLWTRRQLLRYRLHIQCSYACTSHVTGHRAEAMYAVLYSLVRCLPLPSANTCCFAHPCSCLSSCFMPDSQCLLFLGDPPLACPPPAKGCLLILLTPARPILLLFYPILSYSHTQYDPYMTVVMI